MKTVTAGLELFQLLPKKTTWKVVSLPGAEDTGEQRMEASVSWRDALPTRPFEGIREKRV